MRTIFLRIFHSLCIECFLNLNHRDIPILGQQKASERPPRRSKKLMKNYCKKERNKVRPSTKYVKTCPNQ